MAELNPNTAVGVEATPARLEDTSLLTENVTICLVSGFMAPWYSQIPVLRYLKWKGWRYVECFKYDSMTGTIESKGSELATWVAKLAEARPNHNFYFYCTSMGNLVLRSAWTCPNMPESSKRGRHVLVAPPWRGAAWGRFVDQFSIARWVSGDGCGRQLRMTAQDGFDYMGHHPPSVSALVIAGTANSNWFIPRPNDGTVCLEETILRTPHWRVVVPWAYHSLFNLIPSVLWYTHQFFLGATDIFELHPGLNAVQNAANVVGVDATIVTETDETLTNSEPNSIILEPSTNEQDVRLS